ncbi:MAG TPA: hypothetical protein VM819_15215 [Vicinamibacterales bacterium]|jgi:hypothetical protein|nr:hypothetical protein [Vicinamibacterales bacterium]
MRRAIQLLVVALIAAGVWSCGVNNSYDRLRHGTQWVKEKVGF